MPGRGPGCARAGEGNVRPPRGLAPGSGGSGSGRGAGNEMPAPAGASFGVEHERDDGDFRECGQGREGFRKVVAAALLRHARGGMRLNIFAISRDKRKILPRKRKARRKIPRAPVFRICGSPNALSARNGLPPLSDGRASFSPPRRNGNGASPPAISTCAFSRRRKVCRREWSRDWADSPARTRPRNLRAARILRRRSLRGSCRRCRRKWRMRPRQ